MIFIKCLLIGLLFGVPIGAVGTLTLQRTIQYNDRIGFFTGLGSSFADIFYAIIGIMGISIISDFLLKYQTIINILGSSFILGLGINTIKKNFKIKKETERFSISKAFLSSFFIGITNPTTILTFIFAFSYFEIGNVKGIGDIVMSILGIFVGTTIWWIILVIIANKLKNKVDTSKINLINKILGIILIVFSISIVVKIIL